MISRLQQKDSKSNYTKNIYQFSSFGRECSNWYF